MKTAYPAVGKEGKPMNHINKKKEWVLRYREGNAAVDSEIAALSEQTGLSLIMARLLYTRGYRTPAQVNAFFRQEEVSFHDPYLMRDVASAVARIERALENGERIAIYGDYDVDGVTSVSLLYLYLSSYGADVVYYIPSRTKEGYGLSRHAIHALHERGISLMITVDTGITAIDEIAYASELGIDTVVTDHHECRAELPQACAVVNPHRADDSYPFQELAGVGVVFKLVCALEMSRCRRAGEADINGVRRVCRAYADLVAIGTIADVMPVTDENRLIISLGLRLLENTSRPGLRALIEAASGSKMGDENRSIKKRKINSSFIGFTIAPRMNAAGRVSSASIAVELLLCEDSERATALAEELCALNLERQVEENRIAESAYKKIEKTLDAENNLVIVIDDDEWKQGIIGIVSSRITERYGLPSILISFDGAVNGEPCSDDVGKGSGRSVKGLNLVEALTDSEDLLVRFGGHELAAGLSIRRGDINAFRQKINCYASKCLNGESPSLSVEADCEVQIKDLTLSLAQEIASMEPFGTSNPVPGFVLRDARICRVVPMGGGKHMRMILEKDGIEITAVRFGVTAEDFAAREVGELVDVLFQLNINEYQGVTSLQMILQDILPAQSIVQSYLAQSERYEQIRMGEPFDEAEDVLPSRDDIAIVYTLLRKEFRAGHTLFSMRRLLPLLETRTRVRIGYVKLKFIIRIMQELQICGVSEASPDTYQFEFQYQPTKTNIEKSSILRKLKSQMRRA